MPVWIAQGPGRLDLPAGPPYNRGHGPLSAVDGRAFVLPSRPSVTPQGAEHLLRTDHLTKDYGHFRALDDLNLSVYRGEVFGILGPNGSGKTTALRVVLGFLKPTAGHAWVAGHECWSDGVAARRHLAYLPGELRLYENLSGRQLVQLLSRLRGRPATGDLEELAHRFDIDLDRPLATLSSGMKRKVALLQVLVAHAELVIMDEPTNALDPTMRDELLEQVRQARARGQAVVFSSHVLSEVEQVCDRVAILRRGRLVHVEELSALQKGRLVHVRFANGGTGPAELPPLDGLVVREKRRDGLILETTGELAPLLEWLSAQPLADLRVEPLGLRGIYQRFHAAEE
jgi:ABC-2 type transport system ATP-binding protein